MTDASVLGRLTDAVILILRYGTARKQVVLRCIDLLERSGTHLLGVAVNAVDLRPQSTPSTTAGSTTNTTAKGIRTSRLESRHFGCITLDPYEIA